MLSRVELPDPSKLGRFVEELLRAIIRLVDAGVIPSCIAIHTLADVRAQDFPILSSFEIWDLARVIGVEKQIPPGLRSYQSILSMPVLPEMVEGPHYRRTYGEE